MKSYSTALRCQSVEVDEQTEQSPQQGADVCGGSPATVRHRVRRRREPGSTAAFPHAGGRSPVLTEKARRAVEPLLKERNEATLAGLGQRGERTDRKEVSLATISRLRQRLERPRKKRPFTLRHEALPAPSPRVPRARTR